RTAPPAAGGRAAPFQTLRGGGAGGAPAAGGPVTVASAQAGAPRPGVMWGGSGLRIAMFSESYLPRISGVVHSLTAFASSLRAEGHRVFIVAPRVRGYLDADPDVLRVPSVPTPYYDFPLGLGYTHPVWRTLLSSQLAVVDILQSIDLCRSGDHRR